MRLLDALEAADAELDAMIEMYAVRNYGKCLPCVAINAGLCRGWVESREECRANIRKWAEAKAVKRGEE